MTMAQTSFWLKFSGNLKYGKWYVKAPKSFSTKPSCGPREVLMKCTIRIPEEYFEKPVLQFEMDMPEFTKKDYQAKIAKNVADHVQKNMGIILEIKGE